MTNEELVTLAKSGDISAIENLYTQNRGLIYWHIRRFLEYGYDEEDIMQEAYFALIRAVNAYDENSGYKFAVYLSNAVKWYFPRYIKQDKNRLDLCTLDEPITEDSETTRASLVPDENAEFEDSAVYDADMSNVFDIVKDALSDRPNGNLEYNVIHSIFADGRTKVDLGKEYNVSYERIRQIERDTLRHLKNPKYKKLHAYAEYVADKSIYHSGLKEFKYTDTSGVEWAVLKLDEKQNTHESINKS